MAGNASGISTYDETSITVRGENLCDDLVGKIDLTEFILLLCLGERPDERTRSIVEAAIVTLAEHGNTPSAIATRLTLMGAPESFQGAVAAGILGVGDQFVGTVEQVAPLLAEMCESQDDLDAAAAAVVARYRAEKKLIPGFGQPHHKPDDPRPIALFALGQRYGANGQHVEALKVLGSHVDASIGRHMTINAPAAISALFLDLDIPVGLMRGIVVISRCIGLVAHAYEESVRPIGRTLWKAADGAIDYDG